VKISQATGIFDAENGFESAEDGSGEEKARAGYLASVGLDIPLSDLELSRWELKQ
jgi:hypothetical protein